MEKASVACDRPKRWVTMLATSIRRSAINGSVIMPSPCVRPGNVAVMAIEAIATLIQP